MRKARRAGEHQTRIEGKGSLLNLARVTGGEERLRVGGRLPETLPILSPAGEDLLRPPPPQPGSFFVTSAN